MNVTFEPPANMSNSLAITTGTPKLPPLLLVNNIIKGKFLPLTVVLWFYLLIGVFGNSLVMFVYWTRKKPVREDRYFIPLLALVDLISCAVSSGTGIYAQTYPLMFDSNIGCKMAAFLGILFAGISANCLLVIAVDRFLKLCRPFGRQMTLPIKKNAIIGIFVISLAFSLPALSIYRTEQVPMKLKSGYTIQTWKCIDTKDEEHATGHIIYKVFLFVMTMIRFVVLFLCYGNIIWVIFRQRKQRLRMGSVTSYTSTSCSNDAVEHIKMNVHNSNEGKSDEDTKETKENGFENGINTPIIGIKPRKQYIPDRQYPKRKQSVVSTTGSVGRRGSVTDRQGVRLTIIFILITFIYIVTYGPKVWLMVEQSLNRDFWSTVPQGQLLLFRFLHSFYIFNNIVNPIVYGIMDRRFRADCKKRFTRCK
ncbi:G-protein coupled receptor daf-38-like [Mizuhopecten yessoensis]|uniref:Tachykinin-like peptides receptor 99D n=1 Tax=Mizuhopecten yessoensis TaxID=6573 RepID=A0A210Q9M8_MIZYE|nr:G-protein coupled receptor daf-38-like [Mizuhopecten yessoensis]OWF45436.1 Tachykinin-like peptides receptor 99D [Mizuhopecten yessoensis]